MLLSDGSYAHLGLAASGVSRKAHEETPVRSQLVMHSPPARRLLRGGDLWTTAVLVVWMRQGVSSQDRTHDVVVLISPAFGRRPFTRRRASSAADSRRPLLPRLSLSRPRGALERLMLAMVLSLSPLD